MMQSKLKLNDEVSEFLDSLNHPFRKEIEALRAIVLGADKRLSESIKWNGPNYSVGDQDLITMKINPPKLVQLIFHRGAKVKEQPKEKLITDSSGLLIWKENDRAVATFGNSEDVRNGKTILTKIIQDWISVTL